MYAVNATVVIYYTYTLFVLITGHSVEQKRTSTLEAPHATLGLHESQRFVPDATICPLFTDRKYSTLDDDQAVLFGLNEVTGLSDNISTIELRASPGQCYSQKPTEIEEGPSNTDKSRVDKGWVAARGYFQGLCAALRTNNGALFGAAYRSLTPAFP